MATTKVTTKGDDLHQSAHYIHTADNDPMLSSRDERNYRTLYLTAVAQHRAPDCTATDTLTGSFPQVWLAIVSAGGFTAKGQDSNRKIAMALAFRALTVHYGITIGRYPVEIAAPTPDPTPLAELARLRDELARERARSARLLALLQQVASVIQLFGEGTTAWVRDLAEEGIEPNPGPGYYYAVTSNGFATEPTNFNMAYLPQGVPLTLRTRMSINSSGASNQGAMLFIAPAPGQAGAPSTSTQYCNNPDLMGTTWIIVGTALVNGLSTPVCEGNSVYVSTGSTDTVWISYTSQTVYTIEWALIQTSPFYNVNGVLPIAVTASPDNPLPVSLPSPAWVTTTNPDTPAARLVCVETNPGPGTVSDTVVLTYATSTMSTALYTATDRIFVPTTAILATPVFNGSSAVASALVVECVRAGNSPTPFLPNVSTVFAPNVVIATFSAMVGAYADGATRTSRVRGVWLSPGDELVAVVASTDTSTWYIALSLVGIETNPGPLPSTIVQSGGEQLKLRHVVCPGGDYWVWASPQATTRTCMCCNEADAPYDDDASSSAPVHTYTPDVNAPTPSKYDIFEGIEYTGATGNKRYRTRRILHILDGYARSIQGSPKSRLAHRYYLLCAIEDIQPAHISYPKLPDLAPAVDEYLATYNSENLAHSLTVVTQKREARVAARAINQIHSLHEGAASGSADDRPRRSTTTRTDSPPTGSDAKSTFKPDSIQAARRKALSAIAAGLARTTAIEAFFALAPTARKWQTAGQLEELVLRCPAASTSLDPVFRAYLREEFTSAEALRAATASADRELATIYSAGCKLNQTRPTPPRSLLEAIADAHNRTMHALNGNIDAAEAIFRRVLLGGVRDPAFYTGNVGVGDTIRSYAATIQQQTFMYRNQTSAITYDYAETVLAQGSTEDALGNDVAVQLYGYLPAVGNASGLYGLNPQASQLLTGLRSADSIGSTGPVQRTRLDQFSGEAWAQMLRSSSAKYEAQQTGSLVAPLTKLFLTALDYLPLPGNENASVWGNSVMQLDPGPAFTPVARDIPLSPAAGNAPALNALVASYGQFTQMVGGINTDAAANPVNAASWGTTCAVVPVVSEMLGNTWALAFHTMLFLEHPWSIGTYAYSEATDDGTLIVGHGNQGLASAAANTRVPGPYSNVLYVVVDNMNPGSIQVTLPGNTVLTGGGAGGANNGPFGVNYVNIGPALDLLNANPQQKIPAVSTVSAWWSKRVHHSDWLSAAVAAADLGHYLPCPGYWDPVTTPPAGASNSAGNYVANGGVAGHIPAWAQRAGTPWILNPTVAQLEEAWLSQTHPWCMVTGSSVADVALSQSPQLLVSRTLDAQAAVDVFGGLLQATEPVPDHRAQSATQIAEWLKRLARAMTPFMEVLLRQTRAPPEGLFAEFDMSQRNYKLTAWSVIYENINSLLEDVGASQIRYNAQAMGSVSLPNIAEAQGINGGSQARPAVRLMQGGRVPLNYLRYLGVIGTDDYPMDWTSSPFPRRTLARDFPNAGQPFYVIDEPTPQFPKDKLYTNVTDIVQATSQMFPLSVATTTITGALPQPSAFPLCVPSCSAARTISLGNFRPGLPTATFVLWDQPFAPTFPTVDWVNNVELRPAFYGAGYQTFTRNPILVAQRYKPTDGIASIRDSEVSDITTGNYAVTLSGIGRVRTSEATTPVVSADSGGFPAAGRSQDPDSGAV